MRSLILNLGSSCFTVCHGCYNHFAGTAIGKAKPADGNAVVTFLGRCREVGLEKVTFGGGDPLTRPDILDLLKSAKDLGYRVSLDTVGTPLLQKVTAIFYGHDTIPYLPASALAGKVDVVGLPLDGALSQTASLFRSGRSDIVADTLKIVAHLSGAGIDVCINTVCGSFNYDEMETLALSIQKLPVSRWQLFQYMPIGPLGHRNADAFVLSVQKFEDLRSRISSMFVNSKIRVQFKSTSDRNDRYLIVDDNGTAWFPIQDSPERRVIGHIEHDQDRLISLLHSY